MKSSLKNIALQIKAKAAGIGAFRSLHLKRRSYESRHIKIALTQLPGLLSSPGFLFLSLPIIPVGKQ